MKLSKFFYVAAFVLTVAGSVFYSSNAQASEHPGNKAYDRSGKVTGCDCPGVYNTCSCFY